ncbi:MAG: protein translocase SEC61 complex subunit gamma [Candidatus Woesearchaeota archaeon]|nr:protein translocase SEC61 complex subunit gamma [Candidatus Woesearchaeota archaeon]
MEQESFQTKAVRFWFQCLRVLRVTKKPDNKEYKMLLKVSGLGIAVIGVIGFILFMLKTLLLG